MRKTHARRLALISGALGCGLVVIACSPDDGALTDPLDPASIPQFVQALPIPGVMPPSATDGDVTEYRVEARQFEQQILPLPLPPTTVWGYGRAGDPLPGLGAQSTFHSPSRTIETRAGDPVRVTWVNGLVDDEGKALQHLLPVDATLHWADPGGEHDDDSHPGDDHDDGDSPARYTGPVPIVTHVHGAHSFDHSDGHPEAWFLPDATDIPEGFARRGPTYRTQRDDGEGTAVFDYPLDESAATLWYHDHTLGMTRVNVYAGLAGFWIIRDDAEDALPLPGPAPQLGDPQGTAYYEIPLAIQDRSFTRDGELAYPASRDEFGDYSGPYAPDSEVPPIWNPEVFGDVMVVNGAAWPVLEVEPRLYRFRLLNACDARTLILFFDDPSLAFVQVGGDGGLVSGGPVRHDELVVAPAERYDVLVDFSSLAVGSTVTLGNRGPDEAWGGPDAMPQQSPADPATTGRVMQLRVVAHRGSAETHAIPESLPVLAMPQTTLPPRDLVLVEETVTGDAPVHVLLGTVADGALPWSAPATEIVGLGDTEIWRIANTTGDAHPIHLHLVQFRVLDRTPLDADAFSSAQASWLSGEGPMPELDAFTSGPTTPALPQEAGEKDTVVAYPGTVTRIIARFDRAGSFVWHCHIIEHEDNDMMRPLIIAP